MRKALLISTIFAVLLGASQGWAAPFFDVDSKVGSAITTDGTRYTCVVDSAATTLTCAFMQPAAANWTWCDPLVLPATPYPDGGVYLVSGAPGRFSYAFLVVDTGVEDQIIDYEVDYQGPATCLYFKHMAAAPRIGDLVPDLGARLGVALHAGVASVFTVVPPPDAFSQGSLVQLDVANSGAGAWTWGYPAGNQGIVPGHPLDPGLVAAHSVPIAASESPLTGDVIVAAADADRNRIDAVYRQGGAWNFTSSFLDTVGVITVGNSIAIASPPVEVPGVFAFGDSVFTVGSDQRLHESKLECVLPCPVGSSQLNLVAQGWGPDIDPLDAVSDSVAASFAPIGARFWTTVYARTVAGNAATVQTDFVTGTLGVWTNTIPAPGWPGFASFFGSQSLIRTPAGQDEFYGACSGPDVCRLRRTFGQADFNWLFF